MRGLIRDLHRATHVAAFVVLTAPALARYGRPLTECEKTGYWRLDPVRLTPVLQVRNDGIE